MGDSVFNRENTVHCFLKKASDFVKIISEFYAIFKQFYKHCGSTISEEVWQMSLLDTSNPNTCRGSNLTNSLGREIATWTFSSHVIRSCSLKCRQICEPAGVRQTMSLQFLSTFELEGITKHLMTDPAGSCMWDLFPSVLPRGTLRIPFPLELFIKCLLQFWKFTSQ